MSEFDGVHFCIPILPRAKAADWEVVCRLFEQTLRSLENQTCKNLRVWVASHERPDLSFEPDLDIQYLTATWEVGTEPSHALRDKRWKKTLLYRAVRDAGGGYAMQIDADDLLSNRFVEYVLETADPNGYIIRTGYAYDWANDLLAPIPGVWGKGFDSVCGSCAVIKYGVEDLPAGRGDSKDELFYHLKQHAHYADVMEERGRPLQVVSFPAAVYVLNHTNNLHFTIAEDRKTRVPRQIAKHSIPLTDDLRDELSLPARPR